MNKKVKIAMGIIMVMLSPFFVQAQIPKPVRFTVTNAPRQVKAGEIFTITINAKIKGNWHLYSVHNDPDAGPYPTKFFPANKKIKIAGPIKESKPTEEYDPNFKVKLGWHEKEATFRIPVAFLKGTSGASSANFKIIYQVCNDKVCLPPKTIQIAQAVKVSGIADKPVQGFNAARDTTKSTAQAGHSKITTLKKNTKSSLGGHGIFSFIWLAISAGFAALITPCVYPMIPLTVSFFSKQGESAHKSTMVPAIGFGLAIIATFTTLGIFLAAVIGVSGANQFASSPWVNLFIAAVLIVFAFSLLGAFEIRLPYQFTNWLNSQSNERSGLAGILFMALTISAVSFSCTVPFVGGVLAATTGGEWFYPIIGMICFSAAFASPFVVLALFPGWLESLPKSGSWMNIIKVVLGFIELAAAFKFLSNVDLVWDWGLISRPFVIAAWIVIFLLTGMYILGIFVMHHQTKPKTIGAGRLLLAIPFLLFSFYLIPGLMGASMGIWDAWLPPKKATDISIVSSISPHGTGTNSSGASAQWAGNYKMAVAKASKANKPVFIDFTGYTCTNCRAMEANVFALASVKQTFNKMQLVRLYTDGGTHGHANQKFQFKLTGTVALPTYVIIDPHSQKIIKQLEGYTEKEAFQKFLNQGLTIFHQQKSTI